MGVTIPLAPVQPATTAGDGQPGGVMIPLRFGAAAAALTATGAQDREQAVLRAVAAAVALSHTAESLTAARAAQDPKDDLGARLTAVEKAEADLRVVLDEVVLVQEGPLQGADCHRGAPRHRASGWRRCGAGRRRAYEGGRQQRGRSRGAAVGRRRRRAAARARRARRRAARAGQPAGGARDGPQEARGEDEQGLRRGQGPITTLDTRVAKLKGGAPTGTP